ncbi:hypothetical protein HDU97_003617 [Phlyctochytrium planicorne]|nr:hypothetical protein HDU97_003617 [Phlyctochytrium planicorne]
MRYYENVTFQNWAQTYSCNPDCYIEVESEEELFEAIVIAKSREIKVRVVGSGHSPGDIACTDGMLISIDRLNRVHNIDKAAKKVTVEAGIKIKDLNSLLAKNGLALPNLGSISEQTLAGLISTGTHGTGYEKGILATIVDSLRIVKSTLEVQELSRENDSELLSYVLCSLGCLGIITRVTINVVEAFNLEFTQMAIPFDYMINNWLPLLKSAEYVRFWWFPHTNNCVLWKANRSQEPPAPAPATPLKSKILGVWAYETSLLASAFAPALTPHGRNDGPEALRKLKSFIEKAGIKAHAPIEIRFVAADNIPLSPAYKRDTCFIGIIMYRPFGVDIPHDLFWTGYEIIMRSLRGRPHWAKAHPLKPSELGRVYPLFHQFKKLREAMDPESLFVNDYIQRHILDGDSRAKL